MPNSKMERFTQRARRVLTLAEEAAAQFKQPVIGTEHVLLGLLREVHGVASRVLHDLGLEQKRVVELIVELAPQSESISSAPAAELSPETQRLIELAVDEVRVLDQHYIGTEHLLLALVRQEESMAVRILKRFDISLEQVRQHTERMIQEVAPLKREITDEGESTLKADVEGTPIVEPPNRPTNMMMAFVTNVLERVSENKLTSAQGSELLRALQLDMTLTPAGKASFASMINRAGIDMKRRVRVTISDTTTRQSIFEIVNSMDEMLNFVDHFLRLVADNEFESLVFDGDNSPISTELRIEKDEPSE